jgi:FkbH-like protein
MVFDERSGLWNACPAAVWIALRLEDVQPRLGDDASDFSVDDVRRRLVDLARAARQQFAGPSLVSNLAIPWTSMPHWFDANDPDGLTHRIAAANRELSRELQQIPDAHLFDYARVVSQAGAADWADRKLWYLARAAASSDNQPVLAQAIARAVAGVMRPAAKCIVVDLDNTIWGGVLGDDGLEGVQLGDEYPGNVFKDFQSALLGYRQRGFLLAAASKNDETTVLEMFERHPEMLLKRDHFACLSINWEPKPTNLRRIAETLNIGLDSLVFVDDNPVERGEVRATLPMVHVVELPASPLGYRSALADTAVLDRPRLLSEDRQRAAMYESDARRREVEQRAGSVVNYLQELDMAAEVGLCDPTTIERIHQLVQKTNQFNLTTRRHTLEEIRKMAISPEHRVAWLRLRDRYGDLGLVCVGILRRLDKATWEIDTLLMSCRVMGRRVEDAFLAYLAELVREKNGTHLRGVFIPTAKNTPVHNFFAQRKFMPVKAEEAAEQVYESDLTSLEFSWPEAISVVKPIVANHA